MFFNNKILVGKNDKNSSYILPSKANRHGIISGASGSGKTITLKVLAESFSSCGVPVFLVDVKGDLAGCAFAGSNNSNIEKRINNLDIKDFSFTNFPTIFWDVYGKCGHPIRTTVSSVGSILLSRMLNLTVVQEGVLSIIFKIAEDEKLDIIDLKDLKSMLNYVGEKRKEYSLSYGNITTQSIGAIQRGILSLEEEGGDLFFGSPSFELKDFIKFDCDTGQGHINVLHADELFKNPKMYSTFLLWLLTTLYNEMPEVGDLDKPKLVFFIDEAHLVFDDMPDYLLDKIIQIVKLIRSKGIGLYFISQSPSDIPDPILSQLGNRIQHVLRYYTKSDEKAIKAASDSFRDNPLFDTKEEIMKLATGEALVSFQTEDGEPSIVEKVTILPPQSRMGTITSEERKDLIANSVFYNKYEEKIDHVSAFEKISDKKKEKEKEEKKSSKKKTKSEKMMDKFTNKVINTIGRKVGNSIFKLFK